MQASLRTLLILSFIAGFADAATFTHLYGLFSSHVTGNFVLLAASIGFGPRANDLLKILSFPVFIAAAFGATLYYDHRRPPSDDLLDAALMRFSAGLLIAGGLIAMLFAKASSGGVVSTGDAIAGLITVAAMGIQNALQRLGGHLGAPTTVMTGNVTQMTVSTARKLFPSAHIPEHISAQRTSSLFQLLWISAAFFIGCLTASALTLLFGLSSLIFPGVVLFCLIFLEGRPASIEKDVSETV
jgi:uncharacterized membrane protein YoaK (UPF0700 family)